MTRSVRRLRIRFAHLPSWRVGGSWRRRPANCIQWRVWGWVKLAGWRQNTGWAAIARWLPGRLYLNARLPTA